MKAIDYIKSELKSFILIFPQTMVRYEFVEDILTHYIEVVPNNVFRLDEKYISWESNFYDSFSSKYPYQNICFLTNDSLVNLSNIQFELVGESFVGDYVLEYKE